jgi:hypothetical protein
MNAAGSGGSAAGSGGRATGGGSADAGIEVGAACTKDTDCGKGKTCDQEIAQLGTVSGAPGGQVDLSLFPGGSCTPVRLAAYDSTGGGGSCDPSQPTGAQGCGPDGVCLPETVSGKTLVGCRHACEPSATESGCSRTGYTCDFGSHACVEGCRSDTECRVLLQDTNGDGQADSASYDRASDAVCSAKTGRCEHPAGAQAPGQSCGRDDDCEADGICITAGSGPAGQFFPGGFCSKVGCDIAGRECQGGNVCEALRPWLSETETNPICLARCTVGAEPAELQLGTNGHAEGCRAGYRCHYNGGNGAESGVCVGGNYNAVTKNDIGSACQLNSDCYSPFGIGRCLSYGLPNNASSGGICTILDCNVPGLPKDLCGSGNECVASQTDQAFCAHNCAKASECPAGFACFDDDGDTDTAKICYPICEADVDCRASEHCKLFSGQTIGQCVLQ